MKEIKHLDELQLLKRGNVFKHGLFSLVGLLLINALLYSCGIEWASGKWAELTIILLVVVLCSIEFIYYDIYPLTERKQKYLIYFSGLFGFVALIACIYDLVIEEVRIVASGKITDGALGIIYGILFMVVFLTYILKVKHNAKHENEE
ncbi:MULTISPECIES: hypothetical protein [unclassified Breznakia]|uniref:hypothetical protein n=1 Tax=unclassified Breznakia TaxID=2623764 RepID=UPI00247510F5|nr:MULTISPECIES: hypothetical protein [unclassified Breznakia]MDH6368115.1 hypothetical protein [Breznakia sp. PH1-1]MDH6405202.1 hypothetical protein [Breznakia sp. PF1-11]MDH6412918.1 hypothetical protein [Breznakia sp. PFB1-11]MDH6415280.1 hypothetical protein [Breznakia sp. PFB1-14]MDH6417587.1 hypothetical protein [Breznakia sp. PFB1-4]